MDLVFSNDAGEKTTVTFECFVEDYAKAKARIPKLTDTKGREGWTYNAIISPKFDE